MSACYAVLTALLWSFSTSITTPVRATPSARDPLLGLYRATNGQTLIVWMPADGQVAIAFDNGDVRGLTRKETQYSYGPSLGVGTPEQGTLTFVPGDPDNIRWGRAGVATLSLARVSLVERELRFANGRTQLAGTLVRPAGPGPFPAVVLLHGSGAETREGSRVFAYFLATQGVASLIYDKRSVGESKGGSVDDAFADFARDAIAGVHELQRLPEIRRDRIGLFGPSQGAWVALEASRRTDDVAFLWLQSGDATSPLEQEMQRGALVVASRKLNTSDSAALQDWRRLKYEYAIEGKEPNGWKAALATARAASWFPLTGDGIPNHTFWSNNGHFDPLPILDSTTIPVLAVFGARDTNKDAALNAQLMRDAFRRAQNDRAQVMVIDNANHGIFETMTGQPLERELPKLTRLAPGYLEAVRAFVERHVLTP